MHGERSGLENAIGARQAFSNTQAILRVPDEILLEFISEVTYCDHSQTSSPCEFRQIRHLMLVCKAWYQVIVNSYRLWSRLCLIIGGSGTPIAWVERQRQYLDICLQRCRYSPLEVTIELQKNISPKIHAAQRTPVTDLVSYPGSEDYALHMPGEEIPVFEAYYQAFIGLVSKLLGINCVNMTRCRNLTLQFCTNGDLVNKIWPLFNHQLPELRRLFLASEDKEWNYLTINAEMVTPSLESMSLAGHFGLLHAPESGNLQDLDFELHSWDGFDKLRHFTHLRNLFISCQFWDHKAPISSSIVLPQLEHLELEEEFPDPFYTLFQLSNLPMLTIQIHHPIGSSFPLAPLFNVVEALVYNNKSFFDPTYRPYNMEQSLEGLFCQLTRARVIGVPDSMVDTALGIVNRCRTNHTLINLHCIRVVDEYGEFTDREHVLEAFGASDG